MVCFHVVYIAFRIGNLWPWLFDFKISEDLSYIGKEFSIAHRSAFSEKKKEKRKKG